MIRIVVIVCGASSMIFGFTVNIHGTIHINCIVYRISINYFCDIVQYCLLCIVSVCYLYLFHGVLSTCMFKHKCCACVSTSLCLQHGTHPVLYQPNMVSKHWLSQTGIFPNIGNAPNIVLFFNCCSSQIGLFPKIVFHK